jgi:hypothetical protein
LKEKTQPVPAIGGPDRRAEHRMMKRVALGERGPTNPGIQRVSGAA